jgi:hypothetical protein
MSVYQIAGRISFLNITGVQVFSMTRSRGIQPGTIQFAVPVQPTIPTGTTATMFLSDGIREFAFPECSLSDVQADYSNGQRYIVTLFDYRWKWAFGQISGQYNTIRGGLIVQSTRKKPQELAKLCLAEMGVAKYDIKQIPNDTYPEITWDTERPAAALESLCSNLGCVICPQVDGSVLIAKNGKGKKLPYIQGAELRESLKFGQIPDDIYISAAESVWEVSLKIDKPFAIDRTKKIGSTAPVESIVELDKVTYKPKAGWGNEDPVMFPNVAKGLVTNTDPRQAIKERDRIRGLAQESVWKLFGFKFPFKLPGLPFEVTNINQIIFHDDLVAQSVVSYADPAHGQESESRRGKPFVYGKFYDRKDTGKNNVDAFSHKWESNQKLIYQGGFSMDKDRGVIAFSDAVYSYDNSPNAKEKYGIPELYYRVAIGIKDPSTGAYFREVYKKKTGAKNATKPLWVKRPDLRREVIVDPTTNKPYDDGGDNVDILKKELTKYAGYEFEKLQTLNPVQGTYVGFIQIELDGCIEQVAYNISENGETSTEASYGFEFSLNIPSFDERRRIAILNDFVKKQDQLTNPGKDTKR